MTIFFELFNVVHENDFLNKKFKSFWSHHHIFPYYHNFIIYNYQMTFKFEILIFRQQMKMDINIFEFIYLLIMDKFHPMNYLLIQITNEIIYAIMTFICMKSFMQ